MTRWKGKSAMSETIKTAQTARVLSMLGLCKKAGRLVSGVPLVCDGLREGRVRLVVYAAGAAENSVKRVCDKAKTYECPALAVDTTPETLAKSVGKTGAVAAVGVADDGFARAIAKMING